MGGQTSAALLSRLCAAIHAEDLSLGSSGYPTVSTPPSGNTHLLLSIAAAALGIGLCIASSYLRNGFWTWLKKVFTSRLTLVVVISLWTVMSLAGLGISTWQLLYLRQTMSKAGSSHAKWDFGQVVAVGLWMPALYQLLLSFLVGLPLKPTLNKDNFSWAKAFWNIVFFVIEELCK